MPSVVLLEKNANWQLIYYTSITEEDTLVVFSFTRDDQVKSLLIPTLCPCISIFLLFVSLQCDTSAQGGSPSSTLTCSTASPCSESPCSTLSYSVGGKPSPHSTSPSGTLSDTVPSSAPCPAAGPISPGPPSESPTSTLGSKDSGIIGEGVAVYPYPTASFPVFPVPLQPQGFSSLLSNLGHCCLCCLWVWFF